jgi:hypothetical protein
LLHALCRSLRRCTLIALRMVLKVFACLAPQVPVLSPEGHVKQATTEKIQQNVLFGPRLFSLLFQLHF